METIEFLEKDKLKEVLALLKDKYFDLHFEIIKTNRERRVYNPKYKYWYEIYYRIYCGYKEGVCFQVRQYKTHLELYCQVEYLKTNKNSEFTNIDELLQEIDIFLKTECNYKKKLAQQISLF